MSRFIFFMSGFCSVSGSFSSDSFSKKEREFASDIKKLSGHSEVRNLQSGVRQQVSAVLERKQLYQKLQGSLYQCFQEINSSLNQTFLDHEGRVSMKGFFDISKREVQDDLSEIQHLEEIWAQENMSRSAFIQQNKLQGRSDREIHQRMARAYQDQKKLEKSSLLEMAMMVLFHKILKDRFLVVRTSLFDDYKNGADNLMVDKETGFPICAFDEVHDRENGPRYQEKMRKLCQKAERGWTEIKYGATFQKGAFVKKRLSQVPTFYLGLDPKQFDRLLKYMEYDVSLPPNSVELEVFDQLILSLENQVRILEPILKVSRFESNPKRLEEKRRMYNNLQKFKSTIVNMKEIRASF